MGCGSSIQSVNSQQQQQKQQPGKAASPKRARVRKSKSQYDQLIGKKPNLLIDSQFLDAAGIVEDENSDDETCRNLKQLLNPVKHKHIQRQARKSIKPIEVEDGAILEFFQRQPRTKTEADHSLIEKSYKTHYALFNLGEAGIKHLIENMFYGTMEAQTWLFRLNDKACCYFILDQGQVEVLIGDKQVNVLSRGDSFGELALFYNSPRTASVRSISACSFWVLDRVTFRKSVEEINMEVYHNNRSFMDEVHFFSYMTSEQRDSIAHTVILTKFQAGDFIVNEGDTADTYYVIKSGTVSIIKGEVEIQRMTARDSFGEQALYVSSPRLASVMALDEVECLAFGRVSLMDILGDKIQKIIFHNLIKWSFAKSHILVKLTNLQLERIVQTAAITNIKKDVVIYKNGDLCDKLIVILEGSASFSRNELITKGHCIGDKYLLNQHADHPMDSLLTMKSDGVIASIDFKNIFHILGTDFDAALKKNEISHERKIQQLPKYQSIPHIQLENLVCVHKLGAGQFGQFYLVLNTKEMNKPYALKVVYKTQILKFNKEATIVQEKLILEALNFPFVVQLVRTFRDDYAVYFLLEHVNGVELLDVIRDSGVLTKSDTQFYVGSLILILEYLHTHKIVYRDLKPENIIVDEHGYLTLIDMSTIKQLTQQRGMKTSTMIGTPHYMAPEMIIGKPYSLSVDLWSLGVCLYEFMCGGVPFGEDQDDPFKIYQEIMDNEIAFPSYVRDKSARKLNEQLLSKTPDARLGSSYSALKANHWFDDFDWDVLYSKELKSPAKVSKHRMQFQESMLEAIQRNQCILSELEGHTIFHQKINLDLDKIF